MTRQDEIRKELLLQLYGCRPLTRDAERVQRDAKKNGYDYTLTEVRQELEFLVDEGLLIQTDEPGTTAKRYRIHGKGIRQYEENFSS